MVQTIKKAVAKKAIQNETVEKILHSATLLFSERGFTETSLRTITSLAEVNLASVNYHFGSKKALIQAVFARFLLPFSEKLDQRLDVLALESKEAPSVELLLKTVFQALLEVTEEIDEDPQRFMRLLSLAYAQAQEHLRHFIVESYGSTYTRFMDLLREALPNQTPVESFWRSYFMLGTAVFTLSSYDPIRSILNADYDEDSSLGDVISLLIPSMVRVLEGETQG